MGWRAEHTTLFIAMAHAGLARHRCARVVARLDREPFVRVCAPPLADPGTVLNSRLRQGYRALVVGATGALGHAFASALTQDVRCSDVVAIGRRGNVKPSGRGATAACPPWDLRDETSLGALAAALGGPFHLVIDATGALTLDGRGPEKRLADIEASGLANSLQVNAIGPLLLLRCLSPLLERGERVVWAKLSARVGSIEDNHKGGWYSYRMAKAALNQGLQTAAIELARQRPLLVVAALQPGTVRSRLSEPFVGSAATPPEVAVHGMLAALNGLEPHGRAHFVDHAGVTIPW